MLASLASALVLMLPPGSTEGGRPTRPLRTGATHTRPRTRAPRTPHTTATPRRFTSSRTRRRRRAVSSGVRSPAALVVFVAPLVVACLAAAGACTLSPIDPSGRACDDAHACARGFACVDG